MNIELAEKVLHHVLDNPEQHDQTIWQCETAACIAGWVCAFSGHKIVRFVQGGPISVFDANGNRWFSIVARAASLLEIPLDDAEALFLTMDNETAIDKFSAMIKDAKNES